MRVAKGPNPRKRPNAGGRPKPRPAETANSGNRSQKTSTEASKRKGRSRTDSAGVVWPGGHSRRVHAQNDRHGPGVEMTTNTKYKIKNTINNIELKRGVGLGQHPKNGEAARRRAGRSEERCKAWLSGARPAPAGHQPRAV